MKSPFEKENSTQNKADFSSANIIFVSDFSAEQHTGGAELTTDAIQQTCPLGEAFFLNSSALTQEHITQGSQKIWIFCNFLGMDSKLIPLIVANCNYFIIEYDYKFCRYRSIEKHKHDTGEACDCANQDYGMFISAFFAGSEHAFFMSEKQRQIYIERFPFLDGEKTSVLSSVFSEKDLSFMERLRNTRHDVNEKYAILGSNSWIKGVEETKSYLGDRQIDFDVISGLPYHDMLRKLSEYKGLCFRPLGGDTCPRLVIEAKLLGLELDLNDQVQHASEGWFEEEPDSVELYLLDRHNVFWKKISDYIEKEPSVSGYTTVRNVESQGYPWRKSIQSLLQFCDEVIVVDGGSDDGSYELLSEWASKEDRILLSQKIIDTDDPRFAIKSDGLMKAHARSLCTLDWCWQQDIDEVVHELDAIKIKEFASNLPKSIHLIALPVIEYWGDKGKVRVDVNPWKWRLSRNMSHITHGVPSELRRFDKDGEMFAAPGTDSCDYIDIDSGIRIPFSTFYTNEVHQLRIAALSGNDQALKDYETWFNTIVDQCPGVHHYSWYNLEQKITNYKNYWTRFWQSMYGKDQEDTADNNMFFNKPWSEVSGGEIKTMAKKLEKEMGGWIFHSKVNFNTPTPAINVNTSHPNVISKK